MKDKPDIDDFALSQIKAVALRWEKLEPGLNAMVRNREYMSAGGAATSRKWPLLPQSLGC
jgi:hypothetical protein